MRTQQLKPLVMALAMVFTTGSVWAVDVQTTSTNTGDEQVLQPILIKGAVTNSPAVRYKVPSTTESTTAQKIMETINVVDTEDAVKYMPSLFVRKRNYGDTQPVMATRTWGVGSSARSLVYADGVLLTALVANNNSIGAPRWGMVAPEEIERIDVMYGPFSAAYSGNSMGAVMEITTRMPKKFEATISQTLAQQSYNQYGTNKSLPTSQTSALLGDRQGDLSYWVSLNHQDSYSQPLSFITATAVNTMTPSAQPAGTVGGYLTEKNKLGQFAGVYGAGGMLHTVMDNFKVKAAYDFSPTVTANYTFGLWSNDAVSSVESYLKTAAGLSTYGGQAGFATSTYQLYQQHSMHSITGKSNTQGVFDWEAVASLYRVDKDQQKSSNGVGVLTALLPAGKLAVLDGTGWNSLDLKGIWRPDGKPGEHEVSFGAHKNAEQLTQITYNDALWTAGIPTTVFTAAKGKTKTDAYWLQDVWKFAAGFKATLGGRYEQWQASDGYNFSGVTAKQQLARNEANFSPKASLAWNASEDWLVTGSLGKATRYPTVQELYQLVAVGPTTTNPNPNLRPEQVMSEELAFERGLDDGKLRISLFQEDVKDALISQTNAVVGVATPVTFVTNVDKVRNRGVELAYQQNHVWTNPLELQGSMTFVDSQILADTGWRSSGTVANGLPIVTSVAGKHAPNVPNVRATLVATWHSNEQLSSTLGIRYSGKQYSTLDNIDAVSNVYGSFDSFLVTDIRAQYKFDKGLVGAVGIDNLLNYKYTLFHSFPQRTLIATLKYAY